MLSPISLLDAKAASELKTHPEPGEDRTSSGGKASDCRVGSLLSASTAAVTTLFQVPLSLGEAAGFAFMAEPEETQEGPRAPLAGRGAVGFY